jgi:hypothetical protein
MLLTSKKTARGFPFWIERADPNGYDIWRHFAISDTLPEPQHDALQPQPVLVPHQNI